MGRLCGQEHQLAPAGHVRSIVNSVSERVDACLRNAMEFSHAKKLPCFPGAKNSSWMPGLRCANELHASFEATGSASYCELGTALSEQGNSVMDPGHLQGFLQGLNGLQRVLSVCVQSTLCIPPFVP